MTLRAGRDVLATAPASSVAGSTFIPAPGFTMLTTTADHQRHGADDLEIHQGQHAGPADRFDVAHAGNADDDRTKRPA